MPYHPTKEDIAFAQALFRGAANKREALTIISQMLCVHKSSAKQLLNLTKADLEAIANSPAPKSYLSEAKRHYTPKAKCQAAAKEAMRQGLNAYQAAAKYGISYWALYRHMKEFKEQERGCPIEKTK